MNGYKRGENVAEELSDLFFNHSLATDAYEDACKKTEPNEGPEPEPEYLETELERAAEEFLKQTKEILACNIPTAKELAQDFLSRV